jgi:hypothetical protein
VPVQRAGREPDQHAAEPLLLAPQASREADHILPVPCNRGVAPARTLRNHLRSPTAATVPATWPATPSSDLGRLQVPRPCRRPASCRPCRAW